MRIGVVLLGTGCCDVVLDREEFMNATKPALEPFGPHLYRKQVNLYTGEISRWRLSFCSTNGNIFKP